MTKQERRLLKAIIETLMAWGLLSYIFFSKKDEEDFWEAVHKLEDIADREEKE